MMNGRIEVLEGGEGGEGGGQQGVKREGMVYIVASERDF